ncbi:hypothetical protein EDM52_17240 [Brevibacillus invocatus]|uniref:DUF5937 domain-containing protein n=1 Tax=Brevibacillus invocatus TaxID=173959 RepID=A0A3M8C3Q7_9BACL|nr:DUF5937 family protein [Brevibacillus invocatus]RNB70309.1 hypothetical protein EDM52_17240 [Brevibacillus invocatus]
MQDLPLWLRKHLSIVYLPGNEFFHSLHVLANPEHHATRLAWTEEILPSIPTSLRHQLQEMDALSNQFLNVLDFFLPWEDTYHHSIAALVRALVMEGTAFTALLPDLGLLGVVLLLLITATLLLVRRAERHMKETGNMVLY